LRNCAVKTGCFTDIRQTSLLHVANTTAQRIRLCIRRTQVISLTELFLASQKCEPNESFLVPDAAHCRRVSEHVDGGDKHLHHADGLGPEAAPRRSSTHRDVVVHSSSGDVLVGASCRRYDTGTWRRTKITTDWDDQLPLHPGQTQLTLSRLDDDDAVDHSNSNR